MDFIAMLNDLIGNYHDWIHYSDGDAKERYLATWQAFIENDKALRSEIKRLTAELAMVHELIAFYKIGGMVVRSVDDDPK